MRTSDFNFFLPPGLIAQTPLPERDESRLMVLDRSSENIENRHFYDIIDYLEPGDCLVLNDTRVLPARIYGVKEGTGAKIEILLLENHGDDVWECIASPAKRLKTGAVIKFNDELECEVLGKKDDGDILILFKYSGAFLEILDRLGEMPLPHYITEELKEKERYQTVYSKEPGSAAAPTAGLHFTDELLKKIAEKGVKTAYVTLRVGLGTFRPVKTGNIEDHLMHYEHFSISGAAAKTINEAKRNKKRAIAVGTTSVRTLEAAYSKFGEIKKCEESTNIFIYPGYEFKAVDALITNFHLPESTLIMLVSAFYGREKTLKAYNYAIEEKYRFYSFGDAMFIK